MILFPIIKHPLSIGLILLIQTIFTRILTGFIAYRFWFSYIIFLVIIGGILILFIYITRIASNEKFQFSWKIFSLISIFSISMPVRLFIDSGLLRTISKPLRSLKAMELYQPFFLNSYINYPHSIIYLIIVVYLLITLIAVVKITTKVKGILRQKF